MKLRFCLVSENAFFAEDNKLSVLQMFEKIQSSGFPALQPKMSITTRWEFERKDDKNIEHIQKLEIISKKDGKNLIEPVEKPLKAHGENSEYLQFLVNINGLVFKHEGKYSIKVSIDDNKPEEFIITAEKVKE